MCSSLFSKLTQNLVTIGGYTQQTANAWENTELTVVVPNGHFFVGLLTTGYSSGRPLGIGIDRNTTPVGGIPEQSAESSNGQFSVTVCLYPGTWYVYTKRATVGTANNNYYLRYVDLNA